MVAELADHGRRCSPVGQSPSEGYRLGLDAETSLIQGALYVNEKILTNGTFSKAGNEMPPCLILYDVQRSVT